MAEKNDTEQQRGEEGMEQLQERLDGKSSSASKGRTTGLWMVYVAHALSTWGDNL